MTLNWREKKTFTMHITPDMARWWLKHNNQFNRPQKPSVIEMLVTDMKSGHYLMTHQGVAFDWNGQLVDGQHRLEAIAASGATVEMLVTTGLDPLVRAVVDTHSKRTVADSFSLSGLGRLVIGKGMAANSIAGMWQRMHYGITNRKGTMTREQILDFAQQHEAAGVFAINEFAKYTRMRCTHVAPIMAAVARAFYHYDDQSRLAAFVRVLCTGIYRESTDIAAVHFRNLLIQGKLSGNSNAHVEQYGKACRAIQAFMSGEELNKFYVPSGEPFPLPRRAADAPRLIDRVAGDTSERRAGRPPVVGMAQGALVAAH